MKTSSLVLLCLFATLGAAIPTLGQTPDDPLVGIDRSLREIASLMRLQLSNQRAELAVRRLDIARGELARKDEFDFKVVNDNSRRAANEIARIVSN